MTGQSKRGALSKSWRVRVGYDSEFRGVMIHDSLFMSLIHESSFICHDDAFRLLGTLYEFRLGPNSLSDIRVFEPTKSCQVGYE